MSLSDEIVAGFQAINVTNSDAVLSKCIELCQNYNLTSEEFLDDWLAYSASNSHDAAPTLDALSKLERRQLQKPSTSTACKTPQTKPAKSYNTPKKPVEKVLPQTPTQPSQPKKTETPSKQFSERSNSRSIQANHGKCNPNTFKISSNEKLHVEIKNWNLKNFYYMYERVTMRRGIINKITDLVFKEIVERNNLMLSDNNVQDYSGEMVVPGRIFDEAGGKLSENSLILECPLGVYKGHSIKLNIDRLENVALFSGQTVVVKGNNLMTSFVGHEIYTAAPLPLLNQFQTTFQEQIQIVTAAGPFTLSENLLYEPMGDLLEYVVEHKPNFLILVGPFVEDSPFFEQTFDDMFENIVAGIMHKLQDINVQVILVPSEKDIHHHPVFPTPPFEPKNKYEKLILAPNPAVLDIHGVSIALSSADILLHIHQNELAKNKFMYQLVNHEDRLVNHLFNQRSFYPLYPPAKDLPLDFQMLDKIGMLHNKPNLLILPSDLWTFVKQVGDCIAVNPKKLCHGQAGGTFARIEIRPGSQPIYERILCQILRV